MYEYDEKFYRYINDGALNSARRVLPALLSVLPSAPVSVLDVGCGAGAWLSVWKTLGAEVTGLDGDYVQPSQLLIDPQEFQASDLSAGFDLQRRFDLAQSLEVAEHLPQASAALLVDSLCRHADIVLFSAAPPGQGGENHINEQSYDYWRSLFRERGYRMYDPLRAAVRGDTSVMPWYRYNSFLYVGDAAGDAVHQALAAWLVPEGQSVADVSPGWYQWRKRLVRLLPASAGTWLAILKKSLFGVSLKLRAGRG